MDRFGIDVFLPFEDRVNTVAALARDGYTDRMVLAHDSSCYSDFYPEQRRMTLLPNWNLVHISDDVLPALRERGVTEDQITTMLVDDPRRYFNSREPRHEHSYGHRDHPRTQSLPARRRLDRRGRYPALQGPPRLAGGPARESGGRAARR